MNNVIRVRVIETLSRQTGERYGRHRVKVISDKLAGSEIVVRTDSDDLFWEEGVEGYAVPRKLAYSKTDVYSLHTDIPEDNVDKAVESIANKAVKVLRKVACVLRDHTWEFEDLEVRTLESVGVTVEVAKYRCSGCGATMSNALMGGGKGDVEKEE